MLYSGEISPTRCNNCVFLFAMALLYMSRVTISPINRSTMLYMATNFVIPNGRIRLIQISLGVLVLVSKFRLLGVDEFNVCGSMHHAL